MRDFKDKVVVITGASSGIGEALAYEFAALGARVVVAARNFDRLTEVAERVGKISSRSSRSSLHPQPPKSLRAPRTPRALAVTCDVSLEDDCQKMIHTVIKTFGGIDVLVCNAGLSMRALLDDVDTGVLRRLMDVNFWGTVYPVKFALPWLQRSRGSIVGVSSVAGLHGLPGRTGYSASKFAMTGFLETVRIENLRKKLHVMVACPGFTATNVRVAALTADGTPQGVTPRIEDTMMSPEEVAHRIVKGIRRRRRLLLMEWEGRATNFIKKFAPGLLDKLFYNAMAREHNSPLR